MSTLAPLETLYEVDRGSELRDVYGRLAFPPHQGRPYVIGNFVTSLDGVASLQVAGQAGGGPISGFNPRDHLVMGLLRAAADAVIVGAGTLRAVAHPSGPPPTSARRSPAPIRNFAPPWGSPAHHSTSSLRPAGTLIRACVFSNPAKFRF
jgi:hypothetical protein